MEDAVVIKIITTPNPHSLIFSLGKILLNTDNPVDFVHPKMAYKQQPTLIKELFSLSEVKRIFLGRDFIAITAESFPQDTTLKAIIIGMITHFFENEKILDMLPFEEEKLLFPITQENENIIYRIKDVLNKHIRPAIERDGGDVAFRGYYENIVYLTMHGACAGCPSSKITLKNGIEKTLCYHIPEVKGVEGVQ